jgi:hypothetical protein
MCDIAPGAGYGTVKLPTQEDGVVLGDTASSAQASSISWLERTRMSRRSLALRDICLQLLPREGYTRDKCLGSATEGTLSSRSHKTHGMEEETYVVFNVSHGHSPYLGCSILVEEVRQSSYHPRTRMLNNLLGSGDPRDWAR